MPGSAPLTPARHVPLVVVMSAVGVGFVVIERVVRRDQWRQSRSRTAEAGDPVVVALQLDAVPVDGRRHVERVDHRDAHRLAARNDDRRPSVQSGIRWRLLSIRGQNERIEGLCRGAACVATDQEPDVVRRPRRDGGARCARVSAHDDAEDEAVHLA